MNIELGIRLTDSNFEYENLAKSDTLSSSLYVHSINTNNQSIFKKSCLNKLFFFWSTKAMNISNKSKNLKIKHLAEGQENQINSLFNIIHTEYKKRVDIDNNNFYTKSPHQYFTQNKKRKKSSCPLFISIVKSNMKELLLITVLSVLVIICRYLQIQLLRLLIIIFKQNDEIDEEENTPIKIRNKIYLYSALFLINKFF